MQRIVTLTTDFGERDPYVPSMKGVILRIAPDVRLVDVTHQISPQDVAEAAFILKQTVPFYPRKTVHLVVVDPGVGTSRHPVALEYRGQYFVGPDNGIFPLLLDNENPDRLVLLDREAFWRSGVPAPTFHGRDIFAPVAAHLARGVPLGDLGSSFRDLRPLRWGMPIADESGVRGWIVHVDHFGNCISNIPEKLLENYDRSRPSRCYVGSSILEGIYTTYADVEAQEPVALVGSSGMLEVAVNGGNASDLLSIRKGDPVNLIFPESRRHPDASRRHLPPDTA